MRALRLAVRFTLLAAALTLVPAATAAAASFTATQSGLWSDNATWGGAGVPGANDDATITGFDVELSAPAPVGSLTIGAGGQLDLAGSGLFVGGDVDLVGGAALVSGSGTPTFGVAGRLTVGDATVSSTNVTVAESGGSSPSTAFAAGASTWTSATLTQLGGTSTIAAHTATGLSPDLDDVAVTVTGPASFAALTLQATSAAGSITFRPGAAAADPSDPALLELTGALTASGTQTATVDWTGYAAQFGDRVNLLAAGAGALAGLTTTDTSTTRFTTAGALLFAQFGELVNMAAPTVASDNATSPAHARPGEVVTCTPGTWSQPSTYAYTWKRGAATIAGQTASTYTVTNADHGASLTCAVTATAGHLSASASASNTVSVPVAPRLTFGSVPATVTTESVAVAYALGTGTTITDCTRNGSRVASCANPIVLRGYPNGTRQTLTVTARNGAGETITERVSFDVRIPPPLGVDVPAGLRAGQLATVAIRTDADATITCAYQGAVLPCGPAGAQVVVPPQSRTGTLRVTASTGTGTTTVEQAVTAATAARGLPSTVTVAAGAKVSVPSPSWFGAGPYRWQGPIVMGWTGAADDPSSWALTFTAPTKAGTYRQSVLWGGEPGAVDTLTVRVLDPGAAPTAKQLSGVTSPKAPLACPSFGAGTTFTWWVDGVLQRGVTGRTLADVPRTGTVSCATFDGPTGRSRQLQALVDRGTRLAASVASSRRALSVSASGRVTVRAEVSRRGSRAKQTVRARVTRGTTTVRLRRALPARGYEIRVRIVRSGGGTSAPLTIVRR